MTWTQGFGLYLIVVGLLALALCRNFRLNKDPRNDDSSYRPDLEDWRQD